MDVLLAFLLSWVGQLIDFADVICLFTLLFFFFLLLAFFVFIFFWPCYVTYGIFTLQGIEPKPSRVRTRSPDHETAREVPVSFPFSILFSYCLDSLFEAFKTRENFPVTSRNNYFHYQLLLSLRSQKYLFSYSINFISYF